MTANLDFSDNKSAVVDYLGTCRFYLNCKTALRVRRHLKKKAFKAWLPISVRGRAHMTQGRSKMRNNGIAE